MFPVQILLSLHTLESHTHLLWHLLSNLILALLKQQFWVFYAFRCKTQSAQKGLKPSDVILSIVIGECVAPCVSHQSSLFECLNDFEVNEFDFSSIIPEQHYF